jgi:hypothetical protein
MTTAVPSLLTLTKKLVGRTVEVRFKHSVFDDEAYGSYESWERLEQAGDSYRVVAATTAHHDFRRL